LAFLSTGGAHYLYLQSEELSVPVILVLMSHLLTEIGDHFKLPWLSILQPYFPDLGTVVEHTVALLLLFEVGNAVGADDIENQAAPADHFYVEEDIIHSDIDSELIYYDDKKWMNLMKMAI
jgi:hypothetical protein